MGKRIDLPPLPPSELPGTATVSATSSRKPASRFRKTVRGVGWLFGGPGDWFGRRSVGQGAALIGSLIAALRARPRRDTRFHTEDAGAFDLRATAFSYGVSVPGLEARLAARRRQTALLAYGSFALGCVFLLAWLGEALSMTWSGARVVSALEFLPFCGLLFLLAFYNALLNFQIRTGRLASWREYVVTSEPFLPR